MPNPESGNLDALIAQAKDTIRTLEAAGSTGDPGGGGAGQPGDAQGGLPVLDKYPDNAAGVQGMHKLIAHATDSQNALVESERKNVLLQTQLEQRMSPANQAAERDYFAHLEKETGVRPEDIRPAIQQESRAVIQEELKNLLGPSIEEAQALQSYTDGHEDFNPVEHRQFLAKNGDVKVIVEQMRSKGAYEGALEYGELRRKLFDAATKQAAGEAAADERQTIVNDTRRDAGIVSGSGSGAAPAASGKRPLSTERLTEIFEKADSGNYDDFNEEFIHDDLPTEEEFVKIFNS